MIAIGLKGYFIDADTAVGTNHATVSAANACFGAAHIAVVIPLVVHLVWVK